MNSTLSLTSSTVNLTCPGMSPSGLNSFSPGWTGYIPDDIYAFMTGVGNETATQAMLDCCAPNVPQVADLCHMWCEVPSRLTNSSLPGYNEDRILTRITDCMRDRGVNVGVAWLGKPGRGSKSASGPAPSSFLHQQSAGALLSLCIMGLWTLVLLAVQMSI
ncbi:hypothetical protein Micbo1qcDRAFT_199287 [Microdochium bolleyi]|uniref:Uncharacterized protein n=1 Tax=Microdochium bolleyi TaxID=196109 RepID=A0A136JHA9_9PEZI|nr:hypothetical protein Micbo1qcDRAFT_199287 [Microdochium bolleyi]